MWNSQFLTVPKQQYISDLSSPQEIRAISWFEYWTLLSLTHTKFNYGKKFKLLFGSYLCPFSNSCTVIPSKSNNANWRNKEYRNRNQPFPMKGEKKVLKTPTHQNDWTLTTVEIMMLGTNFQNCPLCLMQVVWGVLAHIFWTCLGFACKCFHNQMKHKSIGAPPFITLQITTHLHRLISVFYQFSDWNPTLLISKECILHTMFLWKAHFKMPKEISNNGHPLFSLFTKKMPWQTGQAIGFRV